MGPNVTISLRSVIGCSDVKRSTTTPRVFKQAATLLMILSRTGLHAQGRGEAYCMRLMN